MSYSDVVQQTAVEQAMLENLMKALRETMAWQVEGEDGSRKLSTLRFIAQSFQRHLEHLMTLEEYDGYMDLVMNSSPHLSRSVQGLRQEHDQFRSAIRRIVQRLERQSAADQGPLAGICNDLRALLEQVDAHDRRERGLWLEAFGRDGGGEG
jgi:hemerythrin-like domain-containing protein